jgi:hypothetical protein
VQLTCIKDKPQHKIVFTNQSDRLCGIMFFKELMITKYNLDKKNGSSSKPKFGFTRKPLNVRTYNIAHLMFEILLQLYY